MYPELPLRRSVTRWALRRLQIATLIGHLSLSLEILTAEFEHEQTRVGVRDLSDPAYPVLARSLRTRRENIRGTIAMLEALIQGTPKAAQVGLGADGRASHSCVLGHVLQVCFVPKTKMASLERHVP
jgi:hypothetical protein